MNYDACTCKVFGRPLPQWGEHAESCPQTGLLWWRVYAAWPERHWFPGLNMVVGEHRTVLAHTTREAIHRAFDDLEPRHAISCVGTGYMLVDGVRVQRWHFDMDDRSVVVEECTAQYLASKYEAAGRALAALAAVERATATEKSA